MFRYYYGYYNSPIGLLEIMASDTAIKSVDFVYEEKETTEDTPILREVKKQFDEYFNGLRKDFDINLEVQGTDFQKRVWNALEEIPYGVTLSYKEMAIKLENPKAIRAVGNANSKNRISIIIPCHRVIGADHSLTGYAGGLDRKKWLLEHEKKFAGSLK